MKIEDIMIRDVISVTAETPVSKVADIIFQNHFHGVPVIENEKVIGIITENDFFLKGFGDLYLPSYLKFIEENKMAENLKDGEKEKIIKLISAKAKDIMSVDCLTFDPEMDIQEMIETVKKTKFTTFPVVDGEKKLVGIVTMLDVIGTIRGGSREMAVSMKKSVGGREIDQIAGDLDSAWKDNFVLMSKRKVNTWKGVLFVSLFTLLAFCVYIIFTMSSGTPCV
jgi:acetoin utilization protein AcuB